MVNKGEGGEWGEFSNSIYVFGFGRKIFKTFIKASLAMFTPPL